MAQLVSCHGESPQSTLQWSLFAAQCEKPWIYFYSGQEGINCLRVFSTSMQEQVAEIYCDHYHSQLFMPSSANMSTNAQKALNITGKKSMQYAFSHACKKAIVQ